MRILKVMDIHYTLECEFVKIETVTHIVVGRYSLRIVVYHHSPVSLVTDCLKGVYGAPVELNRTTDTVSTGSENDY